MDDTDLTTRFCSKCGAVLVFTVQVVEGEPNDANTDPDIQVTPQLERIEACKACGWRKTL